MNEFPKGINKIIEEYCCYLPPFQSELLRKTEKILGDTITFWSYGSYFVDLTIDKRGILFDYGIIKTIDGWATGDKRKISRAEQLLLSMHKAKILSIAAQLK